MKAAVSLAAPEPLEDEAGAEEGLSSCGWAGLQGHVGRASGRSSPTWSSGKLPFPEVRGLVGRMSGTGQLETLPGSSAPTAPRGAGLRSGGFEPRGRQDMEGAGSPSEHCRGTLEQGAEPTHAHIGTGSQKLPGEDQTEPSEHLPAPPVAHLSSAARSLLTGQPAHRVEEMVLEKATINKTLLF